MPKNKLEQKVEELASSEVDTFIRRNQNKKTTGRNVRPVIQSWADELDHIASTTDKHEAPAGDFQRVRKAANTLRNILKSKDDEITYFIVNAPEKFWDTLSYIINDTFNQRTYAPQPLTKYEIPGYANQRMGLKPSPKNDKPNENNIPDKEPALVPRRVKPESPNFNYSELKKQRELAKDKKEHEEQEEQEQEDQNLTKEQLTLHVPQEMLDKYANQHHQETVEVENRQAESQEADLADLWKRVSSIANQIYMKEVKALKESEATKIQSELPKAVTFCRNLINAVTKENPNDGISLDGACEFAIGMLKASKGMLQDLSSDWNTPEMDSNIEKIKDAYNSLLDFDFFNVTTQNINGAKANILDWANQIVELGMEVVKEDHNQKLIMGYRVERAKNIRDEYGTAARKGHDKDINNKISNILHDPQLASKNNLSNDGIANLIANYLRTSIKSATYNRTKLLVNAIKRLNGYVR